MRVYIILSLVVFNVLVRPKDGITILGNPPTHLLSLGKSRTNLARQTI